jgi:hypothetical protein
LSCKILIIAVLTIYQWTWCNISDYFSLKVLSGTFFNFFDVTIIDKTLTYASETSTLTKGNRKQLNIFERKEYRKILGPVYDNEK